ncbi:MAG TPA: hypothetical protein VII38_04580 [Polyangia bacterium]
MRSVCLAAILLCVAGCGTGGAPPGACGVDGECPLHQYCESASGACVSGCLSDSDCQGAVCDPHGRCLGTFAATDGGAPDLAIDDLSSIDPSDAELAGGAADLAPFDLAVADAWICTGTCPDYAREPNGTPAQATAISVGTQLASLAICPKGDVDYYKIASGHGGQLVVTVTNGPCGSPLRVDLFDSDGTTPIGTSTLSAAGAVARAQIRGNQSPYVRVQAASGGGQNFYLLDVAVE